MKRRENSKPNNVRLKQDHGHESSKTRIETDKPNSARLKQDHVHESSNTNKH